ncbi:MAG TPA: hypothetical protein VFS41_04555 [Edaphobacter sp.]|nr:hypothetical protein [Edaphobacter sp.]
MGRPPLDGKAKNTTRRLVAFPNSLLKRVKAYAEKHEMNISSAIRHLVTQALDMERKK